MYRSTTETNNKSVNALVCVGASVTVTDLPQILPHTTRNVNSNRPRVGWPSEPPVVLLLVWGQDLEHFSSHRDLILGSDIVYLPETYTLLLETWRHWRGCERVVGFFISPLETVHTDQCVLKFAETCWESSNQLIHTRDLWLHFHMCTYILKKCKYL